MADLAEISGRLQKGDAKGVAELVKAAVDDGTPVEKILQEGLISGMAIIGDKFKKNEVYVPEVLIAARAMKAGIAEIEPLLAEADIQPLGKVGIGTVKGDLHDIGKNLVVMMLQGAGFEVDDLGVDVAPETFVANARDKSYNVIGLSALLTTTMPQMKEVIAKLKESGLEVPVMIGGAPVTQDYADEIGASGYAPDAASAVDVAKKLM